MNTLANSVRLTGFLGAAPEIKLADNQKKYARISLATRGVNRNAKKNGSNRPTGTGSCSGTNKPRSQKSIWIKGASSLFKHDLPFFVEALTMLLGRLTPDKL